MSIDLNKWPDRIVFQPIGWESFGVASGQHKPKPTSTLITLKERKVGELFELDNILGFDISNYKDVYITINRLGNKKVEFSYRKKLPKNFKMIGQITEVQGWYEGDENTPPFYQYDFVELWDISPKGIMMFEKFMLMNDQLVEMKKQFDKKAMSFNKNNLN